MDDNRFVKTGKIKWAAEVLEKSHKHHCLPKESPLKEWWKEEQAKKTQEEGGKNGQG